LSGKIGSKHVDKDAILGDYHIKDATIPYGKLKDFLIGVVSVDPPAIAAGASANVDVTVSGLKTTHKVIAMCQSDLEAGLVPQAAYVPAADTLRIRLYNPTGAAIGGVARDWLYIAWIP